MLQAHEACLKLKMWTVFPKWVWNQSPEATFLSLKVLRIFVQEV